jgi:diguanylate cyclase (GGDEF)-like protein
MSSSPSLGDGCGAMVAPTEFGPFDALADIAHGHYIDGFSEHAVKACQRYRHLTLAAGDVVTSRYLLYVEAIALQELGRSQDAVDVAERLLADLGDELDPVWRAKALSVVAESTARLSEHGRAIAAMAEAEWLVRAVPTGTYGHLSASMAVGLALRSFNLLEQADETLSRIRWGDDPDVGVLVSQELALLSSYWGTTLLLIGHETEAAGYFAASASRALAMIGIARAQGNEQMVARGEVIEAYAMMRLGEVALAAARARAATLRFSARPELVETHLLHFVLARQARSSGQFDAAQERLVTIIADAEAAGREMWATAARAALAGVHETRRGPHEGLDHWRTIARNALARVWSEREGRFAALRDRNHLRELQAEHRRIGQAVMQDPLTGLGNRRRLADYHRGAQPGWAVFVDVDDFKAINDTHSHGTGDDVLRVVADILRSASREGDLLIRFGGDEFLVLPNGGEEAAVSVAKRVHQAVLDQDWSEIADGLKVTVSIGVGHATDSTTVLAAADTALITAKRTGRNRIVVA